MKPETIITPEGREVTLIHYIRDGKIACMPNMLAKDMCSQKERSTPHMRTDSIAGVTCPLCKRVALK